MISVYDFLVQNEKDPRVLCDFFDDAIVDDGSVERALTQSYSTLKHRDTCDRDLTSISRFLIDALNYSDRIRNAQFIGDDRVQTLLYAALCACERQYCLGISDDTSSNLPMIMRKLLR